MGRGQKGPLLPPASAQPPRRRRRRRCPLTQCRRLRNGSHTPTTEGLLARGASGAGGPSPAASGPAVRPPGARRASRRQPGRAPIPPPAEAATPCGPLTLPGQAPGGGGRDLRRAGLPRPPRPRGRPQARPGQASQAQPSRGQRAGRGLRGANTRPPRGCRASHPAAPHLLPAPAPRRRPRRRRHPPPPRGRVRQDGARAPGSPAPAGPTHTGRRASASRRAPLRTRGGGWAGRAHARGGAHHWAPSAGRGNRAWLCCRRVVGSGRGATEARCGPADPRVSSLLPPRTIMAALRPGSCASRGKGGSATSGLFPPLAAAFPRPHLAAEAAQLRLGAAAEPVGRGVGGGGEAGRP